MNDTIIEMSDNPSTVPPPIPVPSIPKNHEIEKALKILDDSGWLNAEKFFTPWGPQRVTLLHLAAFRGDIEMSKKAADFGIDLYAIDGLRRNALHYAADQGHDVVVKWLLGHSAVVRRHETESIADPQLSLEDSGGMTALHLAVKAGHVDVVKVLLKAHFEEGEIKDAKKFYSSWNVQPIHLDAYHGDREELKKYSDFNVMDKLGRRPLHYAACQGHIDAIEYILVGSPVVAADIEARDHLGMNAFHYANDGDHFDVIIYLMELCRDAGASPEEPTEENIYEMLPTPQGLSGVWIKREEEEEGEEEEKVEAEGKMEEKGDFYGENIYELLPVPLDDDGLSIGFEMQGGKMLPSEETSSQERILLHHRNSQLEFRDNLGRTPLHLAVRKKSVDDVEFLIESGANVNDSDTQSSSPLLLAHIDVHIGDKEKIEQYEHIIDILVRAGANVDSYHPKTGWTALHYAVILNSEKATQRLFECDSDLERHGRSADGYTPLHLAAACGSYEALKTLLKILRPLSVDVPNKVPMSVDVLDKRKWSPLHFASLAGDLKIVRALMDEGGNLAKKNAEGNTSIHYLNKLRDNVDLVAFFTDVLDRRMTVGVKDNHDAVHKKFTHAQLDFRMFAPDGEDGPQMAVLSALIETLPRKDQIPILQHPLPKAYVSKKWSHLSWVFYSFVIAQVLFTLDISLYAIYLNNDSVASILRRMLYFFIGPPLCFNILQILVESKRYYKQIENLLSLACLAISIVVAVGGEFVPNGSTSWITYPIGVIIPLIWIQTMLLIGRFSDWAFYALIFPTVLRNFLKVFLISSAIIVGFAISFMVLFRGKDTFSDFWQAVKKTMIMMTGEYEYGDLFGNDIKPMSGNPDADENGMPQLTMISSVVFLVFVMLGSIVLMNLMFGLAVNDIQPLLQEGEFGRLLKQAEFIANCEQITRRWNLPIGYLRDKLKSTISPTPIAFLLKSRPPGYYDNLMEDVFKFTLKKRRT